MLKDSIDLRNADFAQCGCARIYAESMKYRFSANTGFLWKELPFLERIRRAAAHGFDAVEFHDEAQTADRQALQDVLAETGLPVISLNIRKGGSFGSAAVPAQAETARADILAAISVAEDVGARCIHVLAGLACGEAAGKTYLENLRFGLANTRLTILIEPICSEQVPGYFLKTIEQAGEVLEEIAHPRIKIMFDCYHVHRQSGSVLDNFRRYAAEIGHVQIAAAQGRAEPAPGELDYRVLLKEFRAAGYAGLFGCEYRPKTTVEEGLGWREQL